MTSHGRWPLAAALLVSACGSSPSAPSDPEQGVTIYADPRFRGESRVLTADAEDLDDVLGGCTHGTGAFMKFNFDDCISSIRIPPGWTVTVYEDPRYRGDSVKIASDVADLEDVRGPCGGDFDDCISSIRVSRP